MRLNDRLKESFEAQVNKSKSDVWSAAENRQKNFRWTEFLLSDPIDYREFDIQNKSIQIARRPRFFDPFRASGRIIFEMEEGGKLKWEIHPFDDALLIFLFILGSFLILLTVLVLIISRNNLTLAVFVSIGLTWTLTGIVIYLIYRLNKMMLVQYGKRIASELSGDNRASHQQNV